MQSQTNLGLCGEAERVLKHNVYTIHAAYALQSEYSVRCLVHLQAIWYNEWIGNINSH